MSGARSTLWAWVKRINLEHSARTAVAATASLAVARECRLPEAYWAPITTIVVTQSTLGASLAISTRRFAGTVLGAGTGALLVTYWQPNASVFGACVFGLGLLCAALDLDNSAYRFAGITLAIVMLVQRARPAWMVATHRFIEVSVGIAVGLAFSALWPEHQPATHASASVRSSAGQAESS
jgi:uncharacterized membrane protein YccC